MSAALYFVHEGRRFDLDERCRGVTTRGRRCRLPVLTGGQAWGYAWGDDPTRLIVSDDDAARLAVGLCNLHEVQR